MTYQTLNERRKRHRLNAKVRRHGYRLITNLRTIYVLFSDTSNLPDCIFALRDKHGYVIQMEI